ncbi:PD-(D/E)XK nuclease family protein, partial [Microbacteriaceae bacterium 4G12]
MFEVKPYPEFSWSMSRHKTFFECKRKYAYQYYVSHNGWRYDAPMSAQQAYFLKKLSNLPMYLGDMLHQSIHTLLSYYRDKELPPLETVEKHIRHQLNQAYKYSADKQLWHKKPKELPLLREFVYGEGISREAIDGAIVRLQQCLHHLYNSSSFLEAIGGKYIHLYESEQFHTFRFNDIKIYIVMDLLYQDENRDKWVIVDWKTGKEATEDRNQLALYSLYLHETHHISHPKIEIRNEYLENGEQR